ncbi:MAG TPA: DUF1501 domain-containing protein [Gemmataceae bacterium]|jgi:uncharacterized protein (DUF1501 family)
MHLSPELLHQSRRNFLATSASGIGLLALASLFRDDGRAVAADADNPLAPRPPHFAPKAKNCICIYLEGAPSQLDLFDHKPKLNDLHRQKLPESFTKNVRFAFIRKETATILGSTRKWAKHGQCGMELSDLLPHLSTCVDDVALVRSMHTEAFNHHPGQLLMNTGSTMFGRPSMGGWMNYGLGSESRDLPGYVVLTAGRGTSGGTSNWSSGFLPSTYQGVLFRNQGDPVLNLSNPPGLSGAMQGKTIEALRDLNGVRHAALGDPEIHSRTAAYELAFRMQAAAPELTDLSGESKATLAEYGLERADPTTGGRGGVGAGGGTGVYAKFAKNCLLARRLIERGVRFVNLYHASWDHHNNLDLELGFNCGMADQPIAALLKDLKQRGLLDSTLVVWLSEFGRTPLGENRPGFPEVNGRDHHPFAFAVWLAGGGVKGGQVIGKTDEIGWNVVEDPIHINDLHATILHLFGLDHKRLTYRFQGRDFRLTDVAGNVVPKLLA